MNKELEELTEYLMLMRKSLNFDRYGYVYGAGLIDAVLDYIKYFASKNREREALFKELQEENKKMKTEIAEHVYWESTPIEEIKKLYVSKDKIREKIEKLNKNRDMISGGYAISILQRLLEGE